MDFEISDTMRTILPIDHASMDEEVIPLEASSSAGTPRLSQSRSRRCSNGSARWASA